MRNNRERQYTEAISVAITVQQREQLLEVARARELSVSALMRESALELIGRADLSVYDETYKPGKLLDAKARPTAQRYGMRAGVTLTKAQHTALMRAAKDRGLALSSLLRDSALSTAGLALPKAVPDEERAQGRPLGTRPKPAKAKPAKK